MTNSITYNLLKTGLPKPTAAILGVNTATLVKTAVPLVLAPNGTVATAGVITLGTALPLVYANAWVRLPAGAVVGGLAGLYFVVFSSTTVGQVYTNYADPATAFTPSIPATLVAAVGSNAAYTQVTTEVTLANVTVPADTMGANGAITTNVLMSNNGTAGAKTLRGKFGGTTFLSAAVTTSLALETEKSITNRGSVASQLVHAISDFGTVSAVAPTQAAVNTAADVSIAITGQIAVATDLLVIESFTVEVLAS